MKFTIKKKIKVSACFHIVKCVPVRWNSQSSGRNYSDLLKTVSAPQQNGVACVHRLRYPQ